MGNETWGFLKHNTPFAKIFPDGKVPLISIFPIIPREDGYPECYLLDAKNLSNLDVAMLAQMVMQSWSDECRDIGVAIAYVRNGLPIRVDHFETVGSSSPALLFGLMDDLTEDFGNKVDFPEDYEEEEGEDFFW
jgi:hypothetical protein